MKKEHYEIETGKKIKRVPANVAHKLYQAGKGIYLYPVNVNPESRWNNSYIIIKKSDNKQWFKDRIGDFMSCNGGGKMGSYCKYFVEI